MDRPRGESVPGTPTFPVTDANTQRYYARFEGSYRANLRELERLQRLQLTYDMHFQDAQTPLCALHDLQIIQRAQRDAKRNAKSEQSQPKDEDFGASLVAEMLKDPELVKRIREQRDQFTKR